MKRYPPEEPRESPGPLFAAPWSATEHAPFQAHSETSRAAAEEILTLAAAMRARVYECIVSAPDGMTDEEGQAALGMPGNTYRPRRRELQQAGMVCDSGRTRPTESGRSAVVWIQKV